MGQVTIVKVATKILNILEDDMHDNWKEYEFDNMVNDLDSAEFDRIAQILEAHETTFQIEEDKEYIITELNSI